MSSYTTKMVARLNELSPITRTVADDLAAEFGLPVRSVISKAVLLGLYPVSYTHLTLPTKRIV